MERMLDRVSKATQDGYPPYNIEQMGENRLRIVLAVAGFSERDIDITVEDKQLVLRGKQEDDPKRVYLHRGIAARQFQKAFVLAEGIEVEGARLDNGLLSIDLVRPTPVQSVKRIKIEGAEKPKTGSTLEVGAGTRGERRAS
ncbi:MAG: Hsp20 family protein [Alphaproteobacteria bacterium]|nr:Hsp20 family protein [Alphaproteobacteria bacterium]